MALPYWTPFVTPDDFDDTTEGLQAYQDAIAPYVVGPYYEDYMQVPGPAGLQELNGGFGLRKDQLAQQWGGFSDGSGPLGDDGKPTDLTRIGAALTDYHNGFNYYTRAKVRPQEALQAYFLLNPDGTPVLPDHILRNIEVALDQVLGPDWFEQAWEEVRQDILPQTEQPDSVIAGGQQPGVAAMPDADERTGWGVPKGIYDGTFTDAVAREERARNRTERREQWEDRMGRLPQTDAERREQRRQEQGREPTPVAPPPSTPAPVVTQPPPPPPPPPPGSPTPPAPVTPEPQISGPGSSGAAPPQDSPQSDWGFDPVTGLYCNNVTGECI